MIYLLHVVKVYSVLHIWDDSLIRVTGLTLDVCVVSKPFKRKIVVTV